MQNAKALFQSLVLSTALCGSVQAADVFTTEQRLLQGLEILQKGDFVQALQHFQQLSDDLPKYKLVQLITADLLALQSGQQALIDEVYKRFPKTIAALQEEAKVRWQFAYGGQAKQLDLAQYALKTADQPYVVFVSLQEHRLFVYQRDQAGQLQKVQDYYITMGQKGTGKQREGDRRTPIGVYHIVDFIEDKRLPDLYGVGALPLNYPNRWDRHQGKTGSGIWVHGVPRDTYARTPRDSRGCVVLSNAAMANLVGDQRLPLSTPVIISDEPLEAMLLNPAEQKQLETTLQAWLGDNRPEVDWKDVSVYRYPNEVGLFYATLPSAENDSQLIHQFWRRDLQGDWVLELEEAEDKEIKYVFRR